MGTVLQVHPTSEARGRVQRGSGGTLGPRTQGRGSYVSVKDVVTEPVVTPTEQGVQQAQSEVKRRRRQQHIKRGTTLKSIRSTVVSRVKGPKQKKKILNQRNIHLEKLTEESKEHNVSGHSQWRIHPEELNLFATPDTQGSYEKIQWVDYRPISQLKDQAPVEFVIPASGSQYVRLKYTYLYLKAKLLTEDGKELDMKDKVGPINNILQSLWSQVDVLNQSLYS